MKIFPNFPKESKCLLCGTNDDEETVLVPLFGTEKDGNMKVLPTHLECVIELASHYYKESIHTDEKERQESNP